jgi:signal recognition particle subunit SEC65
VYPAYLDQISIKKGRKVSKELAIKEPSLRLLAEAVRRLKLECIIEVSFLSLCLVYKKLLIVSRRRKAILKILAVEEDYEFVYLRMTNIIFRVNRPFPAENRS